MRVRYPAFFCGAVALFAGACGDTKSGGAADGNAGASGSAASGGDRGSGGASSGGASAAGGEAASGNGGNGNGGNAAGGTGSGSGGATGGASNGGSASSGANQGGNAGEQTNSGGAGGVSRGGASGASGAAGANTAGAAGASSSACPSVTPSIGDACPKDGLDCAWGDSPFPECRTHLVCSQSKWAKGFSVAECKQTPASVCPSAAPERSSACTTGDVGARCSYDDGSLCTCESQSCGGTGCTPLPMPTWFCYRAASNCPLSAPNAGAPCSGNMTCNYEYCGLTAACRNGQWTWVFGCA